MKKKRYERAVQKVINIAADPVLFTNSTYGGGYTANEGNCTTDYRTDNLHSLFMSSECENDSASDGTSIH